MFPAIQRPNTPHSIDFHHITQAAPAPVPKDRSLHVRRFDFASAHLDLAIPANKALSDIDRVAIVLRKAEEDVDLVLPRRLPDSLHFCRVDFERILDVFGAHDEVHRTGPGIDMVSAATLLKML